MRFIDFINIENSGFSGKKEFQSLMQDFLLSPTLSPFTNAILRSKEKKDVLKKTINPLLKEYWETFYNLPQYQSLISFYETRACPQF